MKNPHQYHQSLRVESAVSLQLISICTQFEEEFLRHCRQSSVCVAHRVEDNQLWWSGTRVNCATTLTALNVTSLLTKFGWYQGRSEDLLRNLSCWVTLWKIETVSSLHLPWFMTTKYQSVTREKWKTVNCDTKLLHLVCFDVPLVSLKHLAMVFQRGILSHLLLFNKDVCIQKSHASFWSNGRLTGKNTIGGFGTMQWTSPKL